MRNLPRPRINPRKALRSTSGQTQKSLYVGAMFNPANGYGDLAKHFCIEADKLVKLGILPHGPFHDHVRDFGLGHTLILPPRKPNALLSIQPTFSLMQPNTGEKGAIFTMFETSKLNHAWIRSMNTFNLAITPGYANAVDFMEQLRIPVEVCNMGHDHRMFTLCRTPASSPFVFGAAAHVGHGRTRKGIERILEWFQAAFPDNRNVRLSLKLNAFPENGIIPDDPRITVIEQDLSDEDCRDWLRSIHCYIDGSTSEGWGMWNHHAMATGRPVIGTNYSARSEYFRFGNHIPIGYKKTPAKDQYENLGHWAMPDRSDAIEAMRWAYSNPDQCMRIGLKAHDTVAPLTWERFAKRVIYLLRKHQIVAR